jgi:hypothetical protein
MACMIRTCQPGGLVLTRVSQGEVGSLLGQQEGYRLPHTSIRS